MFLPKPCAWACSSLPAMVAKNSFSSCARMVCQDQIIVDFSQLQQQKKICGSESALFLQVWLLPLPASTEIYDLAQSMIIPAQNNLFCYFQYNICCFSKSCMISLSELGNHRPKCFYSQSRVHLYYLDASPRTPHLATVVI